MERKLKRWEAALMAGVLCTLLCGVWLEREQEQLAEQVVRLHVVANSDGAADQQLKLAVRDRILEQLEGLYPPNTDPEQAQQIIRSHLQAIEAAGRAVADGAGVPHSVTARMERCWFPTKEYGDFALPAGEYTALRVTVGEGAGQNWWCVAFPPLCLGVSGETVEGAVEAGVFTPGQAGLMTQENGGYVLKFKGMELLGQLHRIWE